MNIFLPINLFLMLSCLTGLAYSSAAAANCDDEFCYRRLNAGIEQLQEQLPAITRSAEQAATAYVKDGFTIAAFGDPGLVSEAIGRAGGLIAITPGSLEAASKTKTIVLFFPYSAATEKELPVVLEMQKHGGMIVLFGKPSLKDAAKKAGIAIDGFIDTGFPCSEPGVEYAGFPADAVMNMAALWCWTGEFVAACTRLGKMPPMYQSYAIPDAKQRAAKFSGLKFHIESPPPVAAGILGRQYLVELKKCLTIIYEKERGHIRAVAEQAAAAVRAGHAAYVSVIGHALVGHLPQLNKTGLPALNNGWEPLSKNISLRQGDFIFAIGYDDLLPPLIKAAQKTGVGLAWSLTDYKMTHDAGSIVVPPGQIFINQYWALGDAVVTVPGYDIRILPPSGVIAETILWMILTDSHLQ